jgi:TolB-like protein/lipopolysaccharide biosynthesis regulator YciM
MRWQDYIILAALAGIGVYIVLGSMERIRTEPANTPISEFMAVEHHDNGVAVLPFENLDPNPDTGYFSDGVADEILSRLANNSALFVMGRTSSFAYRQSDQHPATIAAKLGVRFLLDGTVRRDGDLVRITAHLMDENGSHVWSESFDRKLEKIFSIQSEIADAVAKRVAREVTLAGTPPAARSTGNIEAYSEFLLGKEIFIARAPRWRKQALERFRNAIALDPGYAPAHAYLAIMLGFFDIPEERVEEIETATQTAFGLDAELAEAHVAMGLLYKHRDQNPEAAQASFRRALEIDPTLSIASNLLGNSLMAEGLFNEARQVYQQQLERDPLNPILIVNVAYRYATVGEFEKGEKLMLRLLQLPELPVFAYRHLANLYSALGRMDESIRWRKKQVLTVFNQTSEHGPAALPSYLADLASSYLSLGMVAQAEYWMERSREMQPNNAHMEHKQAVFCVEANDMECGERHLSVLEETLEREGQPYPAWIWAGLGQLHIDLGHVDKGTKYLQKWFDMSTVDDSVPLEELGSFNYLVLGLRLTAQADLTSPLLDSISPKMETWVESQGLKDYALMGLAVNRWLRGNREAAIGSARQAIDGGWIDLYSSRHKPLLGELLASPELQDDLTRLELEIQRQRANVEAADEARDFRQEVDEGLAKLEQATMEPQ